MTPAKSVGSTGDAAEQGVTRFMVVIVLLVTFAVRLLHLRSAVRSPFTFQLGPDEDFYQRFGQAVAGILQGDAAEFAFMDPSYGFLLGIIFKLAGPNLYAVFVLQMLVDTLTACCIFLIGRELGRPRSGLVGAALYGLTSTAVLFSATLLKATWVANYMALWVLFGLILLRTQKAFPWLLFGLFCGYGIALRSNLLLMAALAAVLLPWLRIAWSKQPMPSTARMAALFAIGLALPVGVLAMRNDHLSHKVSLLPNNGGVVLHQVYNADNPRATTWIPPFAAYSHPTEIWRGYAREAERRAGRTLTPAEVDRYWRSQALAYMSSHLTSVAGNILRKLCEFTAYIEVPNNRSLVEERMFSPVLRILPLPFGWLFALGVPGLALLLHRDRRGLLAIAPILVAAATVAVFFAEDRFRFHAVPMLALGAGLFLDDLHTWVRNRQATKWAVGMVGAALLGGTSVLIASQMPQPKITWDRMIWGYVKMGKLDAAKQAAAQAASEAPANSKIQEALGYIAATQGDDAGAVAHYRRAAELKPDSHVAHYNLARMLVKMGSRDEAASQAATAVRIAPLPEYRQLLEELTATR